MNISSFFNSYPGMYVAQSFCHSAVAVLVAERAITAWSIRDPLVRQRFRIASIILPAVCFPLYQVIDPGRGSLDFRLNAALFDMNRWLLLGPGGLVSVGAFFLLLLLATSVVFVAQEMVPVARHALEARRAGPGDERPPGPDSPVAEALASLPGEKPAALLLDEEEPVLFSTTGRSPAIYLSTGLVAALTPKQLQAALAHEMEHIRRSKRPILTLAFLIRILLFFNPVVLVTFRRAVRDEEKICDDAAVSVTRDPVALAAALKRFVHRPPENAADGRAALPLDEYSHNLNLESRIKRLEEAPRRSTGGAWFPFGAAVAIIIALNYFIV